jgi:hypothetical protein
LAAFYYIGIKYSAPTAVAELIFQAVDGVGMAHEADGRQLEEVESVMLGDSALKDSGGRSDIPVGGPLRNELRRSWPRRPSPSEVPQHRRGIGV